MNDTTPGEDPSSGPWNDAEIGRAVAVFRRKLARIALDSTPSVRAAMLGMARNGRSLAFEVSVSLRVQHGRTAELDRGAVDSDEHWRFALVELGAGGGARRELEVCRTSELPT